MNQQQRNRIAAAISKLSPFTDADHCLKQGHAAVINAVEDAKSVFEAVAEEEREKFDNMPEGLQQGDKAQAMEEAADAFESAAAELDNVDLSEHVKPEDGWEQDVASIIEDAIDNAEAV